MKKYRCEVCGEKSRNFKSSSTLFVHLTMVHSLDHVVVLKALTKEKNRLEAVAV